MFLLVTIAYAGVWLALAMLFSVFFRSTATAALVALGLWLFLALLWPALAQMLGEVISPSDLALRAARPADARYAAVAAGRCRASRPARSTARRWWRCSIPMRSR